MIAFFDVNSNKSIFEIIFFLPYLLSDSVRPDIEFELDAGRTRAVYLLVADKGKRQ